MVKVKVESEELMRGRVNGEEVLMVRPLYIFSFGGDVACLQQSACPRVWIVLFVLLYYNIGVSGYKGQANLAKGMDAEEVNAITDVYI